MRRRVAALSSALVLSVIAAGPALADSTTLTFTSPMALPTWAGGEPSVAFDPTTPSHVYVSAPQSVPAGFNAAVGGSNTNGVGFWASSDGGKTFPVTSNVGSSTGGGDSDVAVDSTGKVYVADLEATSAAICSSADHGVTFTSANAVGDGCSTVTSDQQGPDNDRQWVNPAPGGSVYLTYHDLSANVPVIERSTDGGQTFAPCGSLLDPQGPAGQNYNPAQGDLIAKPAVDQKTGDVFVEITEPPSSSTTAVNANLSQLYVAVAQGGCTGATVFKNYTVFDGAAAGADMGNDFNAVAEDGAGDLYVVSAGKLTSTQATTDLYVFTSTDHGVTWSKPVQVNPPAQKSSVMPAITGGLGAGQVAVGWFGCTETGDPNTCQHWNYFASESTDAGKTFTAAQNLTSGIAGGYIHYGNVCTVGLDCGTPLDGDGGNGNRNLADFSSVAVNPADGSLLYVIPGDPTNTSGGFATASAFVIRQTGGPLLVGTGPGADLPESPVIVLLPVLAVAVVGGVVVARRRRAVA